MAASWARIPLRIKLTLAFTGVMAVLLAAAGIALSVLVAAEPRLRRSTTGSRARAGDAAALVAGDAGRAPGRHGRGVRAGARRRRRACCDTTTGAGGTPLLTPRAAGRARRGDRDRRAPRADGAATCGCSRAPVRADGRARRSWSIGESLAQRERALDAPARAARDRRAARAADRLAGRLRARRRRAAAGRAHAPPRRGDHRGRGRRAAAGAAGQRRDRPPRAHAQRDARAAGGGVRARARVRRRRLATSCARRWRSCAPSSSSRCAASTPRRSSRPRCARPPRRPTGSPASPRTCW